MKPSLRRNLFPLLLALVAVSASLAQSLSRGFPPPEDPAGFDLAAFSSPPSLPGITEGQLQTALPGKTLIRTDSRGFQRAISLHGTHGRLITGPALAALAQGHPGARSDSSRVCDRAGADSLARRACLDSLRRAGLDPARDRRDTTAGRGKTPDAPRALREIEERRDTVYLGPDGEEVERPATVDASSLDDEVREARTRGYVGQFFVDLGNGGGWDWGDGDWAVILYVVVGVIVVGAFVLGGGKALYDLLVVKEDAVVFKELGARFSYSGLAMPGNGGTTLYRDAYLYGLRFALGVQRDVMSLGLAVEGGSINLRVRGFPGERNALDFRGAYAVGGPMVRFGNYHPLAFTLEFLNGTSDHPSIGWISKSRMTLAGKTRHNLLLGAHLGAVFYDLEFTDGLVFRRGDLNRDLSMMLGLDLGYAF
jgi:hypothetical protein